MVDSSRGVTDTNFLERIFFHEAVIAPFSWTQIQDYIEWYVLRERPLATLSGQPTWDVQDYLKRLITIPGLINLVSNPFILSLALRALPVVVPFQRQVAEAAWGCC